MGSPKRKADYSPEEWAKICEQNRASAKKYKASAKGKARRDAFRAENLPLFAARQNAYRRAHLEKCAAIRRKTYRKSQRKLAKKLLDDAKAAVPRQLPPEMREDVVGAVMMRVSVPYSREKCRIPEVVKEEIKAYNKQYDGHKTRSLDAVVPGTDNLRLGDTIASDREHF